MPTAPKSHSQRMNEKRESDRKRQSERRGTSSERGYDATWQKLRKLILHRDPMCKECGVNPSTDVDHITPLRQGGENTEANLQGLCHECHSKKTQNEDALPSVPVEIVCGPQGSGRRAYIEKHRKNGDLVVDYEALFEAVSGLSYGEKPDQLRPYVVSCIEGIKYRILHPWKRHPKARKAWIMNGLTDGPSRAALAKELNATVTIMDASSDDCASNLSQRGLPAQQVEALRLKAETWWKKYTR